MTTKVSKLDTVVEKIDNNVSLLIANKSSECNQEVSLTTPASNTRSSKRVGSKKRKGNSEEVTSVAPPTKKPFENEDIVEVDSHNKTFRDALIGSGTLDVPEPVVSGQIAPEQEVLAPQAIEERRWIFVSRLTPNTTAATLSIWLKSKLKCDDILCFPLIPRGFQINELKMISFKMGIPMSLVQAAKNRYNWPPGVQIRDFIVRTVSIPSIEPMDQDEDNGM